MHSCGFWISHFLNTIPKIKDGRQSIIRSLLLRTAEWTSCSIQKKKNTELLLQKLTTLFVTVTNWAAEVSGFIKVIYKPQCLKRWALDLNPLEMLLLFQKQQKLLTLWHKRRVWWIDHRF